MRELVEFRLRDLFRPNRNNDDVLASYCNIEINGNVFTFADLVIGMAFLTDEQLLDVYTVAVIRCFRQR